MRALFVHDHKFPRDGSLYFESYGFDTEFFNRYLNIFNDLEILAREIRVDSFDYIKSSIVNKYAEFYTIADYNALLSKKVKYDIRKKIKSVDALIIRLPSNLGLYALSIAKKLNKPYIIELVGCPFDAYWHMGSKRKSVAPLMYSLTRIAMFSSKYSVYVTDEFLQNRYPSKGKSISCSNVTINKVEKEQLDIRLDKIKKYHTFKNLTLGTIGTIDSQYKGQQYIIQAISELKKEGYSLNYELVGGGNVDYLKDLSKKLGVEENVKFVGKLKHKDVFKWLSNIDLYIQPSDTEGLPRSVIEAMSVSCPVIGSDAGGIPELIEESVIFKKGDINGFKEVFKNLNKEKTQKMAKVNHENSKRYLKNILTNKRESFFEYFIKNEIEGELDERVKNNI